MRPYLDRRREGRKHPVEDFLFTYYSFRPGRLRSWQPGAGVVLAGAEPLGAEYRRVDEGTVLDLDAVLPSRRAMIGSIRDLLAATAGRAAHFGCFGMHEWAMVHRIPADQIRHADQPLRLSPERIAEYVEQREVRCSHYDAFRFFTPAARPLNVLRPERDSILDLEQPGCLHANMDLYKWAYKLWPLVCSDLVADCFELAMEIRVLDMRAAPYDLTALGHRPIPVERPEGRAEYAAAQRAFAERAAGLRRRLLAECGRLLGTPVTDAVSHPSHLSQPSQEDSRPG